MIRPYRGKAPAIDATVYIAAGAQVIGDVVIGPQSSLWFNVVVRGDVNTIRIGARTNVQDLSVLHVTRRTAPLRVGDEVTVGHAAILHGCTVENRCLIGMGAVVMDGAVIGEESIVGAGALVPERMVIPPRSLVVGVPAAVKRSLRPEEIAFLARSAENYVQDAASYRADDASNNSR